jgi:hypothetical protein
MRMALQVSAAYTVVVGVLLLFPAWSSVVFARPVIDAAPASGWGAALITIGLLAYVASTDVMKYGGLAWVFIVGLLLSAVTTPPTEVGGFSGDGPVAVSTPAGPVRARRGP